MEKRKKLAALCWSLLILLVFLFGWLLEASSTRDAKLLHDLGLLESSGRGYELDRPMSRGEASLLFVRLLGAEQEAASGHWAHPFTDVPAWAEQSIGYLFCKGLAKGMTETLYCPEEACTPQMYAVFVLRALGYSEKVGDFTYDSALSLARSLGLLPEGLSGEEAFLRDYAMAVSVIALSAPLKDGSMHLFDKLLRAGAIPPEAAEQYPELSMFGEAHVESF